MPNLCSALPPTVLDGVFIENVETLRSVAFVGQVGMQVT